MSNLSVNILLESDSSVQIEQLFLCDHQKPLKTKKALVILLAKQCDCLNLSFHLYQIKTQIARNAHKGAFTPFDSHRNV